MNKYCLLVLLFFVTVVASAQERKISGTLTDRDTHEAVTQTTVQLLKSDSTFVGGSISNEKGEFALTAPADGSYLLKVSSVGYLTYYKKLQITDGKNLALGNIVMNADAIMLKGATVTGQAVKVTVREDTFVYNSAAFRTPEGSTIEELVKRLPGAQISDDGKITINGKEVKKILIDGKEFMTGDTQTALKNLPTSIVDKIKAYDQRSDLARVSGIDDGDDQTVLDFGIKKGMNMGVFSNIDLAQGTQSRYADRLMGAYFKDEYRVMLFANANNTNDMGFPGGGGRGNFGRNRDGLNATKMLGTNFNYEKKDKLKIDWSVRWNHSDGDVQSRVATENFVSKAGSFSNSLNQSYSRSNKWNARGRLEWQPDSLTNIMFRPTFSYSTSDGMSTSTSGTYNDNPYNYVADPLLASSIAQMSADSLMVNSRSLNSISYTQKQEAGGMLQLNRRLSANGRNVTVRADVDYAKTNAKSLSLSNVHLYQVKDATGVDSTYQTNRYLQTPATAWTYSLQATYSEPLWRGTYLQFRYKYGYSRTTSDRATFDFSNLGEGFFGSQSPLYRGWNSYLSMLASPYESYRDQRLSRSSVYTNYTHELEMMLRFVGKKYKLNAGFMVQPQSSHFTQNYLGQLADTTRSVFNVSPALELRYKFSDVSQLRINYRGTSSQPSMSDLLDIVDDSDPLNVHRGNPGLKPSFTNSLRFFYNTYRERRQQAFMTFLDYSNTRNAVSNRVTYDEITGGRTTQPDNINGNWNANAGLMFNTAIDSAGVFNVNTFTNLGYNNYVGYISLNSTSGSQRNVTRSLSLSERLATSYRNSWFEIELDGSFTYARSKNKLQLQNNLNTWQFAYGATLNFTLPWGMQLSTDLHQNSRRGYADRALNTNELVWNAQLSQSFLKGSPLSVSVQFFDILRQQSNFSRAVNAYQRTDTEYNSINSYAMLHVVYRLNLFGGKDARQQMRNKRPQGDGEGPGGMPPGGAPGGVRPMGSGRPMGGGF
ncbi:MAG: TonB-dependent receptor [Hoylesella shahii]|uniref:TonB-dependent receptor n=1 Tax=Hoylesella shahii TaxID=228603 RepID=UPI003F9F0D46